MAARDNAKQLPHLATFAAAAEVGSFTAAAKLLGLTQAAISQRIQALERNLGVPLFRREGGRIGLTEAGQRLHAFAQRIFALHVEARAAITGEKPPLVGELSLAASSVPGEHLLPAFLSGFRRDYPHVQIRATVTDSRLVLNQVEHGQADLGLVGIKEDKPHLEFRSIAGDQMALVVPAGHAWSKKRRVTVNQLCQQPLILREVGSGSRGCLTQALEHAGKTPSNLHVVLELGSNEAIKDAVQRGLGAAVLSTHVVAKEIQSGSLQALEVSGLVLTRDIFVVRDRRRALPIPAQLFLEFLEAHAEARHES